MTLVWKTPTTCLIYILAININLGMLLLLLELLLTSDSLSLKSEEPNGLRRGDRSYFNNVCGGKYTPSFALYHLHVAPLSSLWVCVYIPQRTMGHWGPMNRIGRFALKCCRHFAARFSAVVEGRWSSSSSLFWCSIKIAGNLIAIYEPPHYLQ